MLEFPEGYFEEEVRDGFAVSGMMKRAWAAQLEILQRVIDICARHGLTYYAYWGTLLGAIRHKGFIPWDDDVDIALKREDYMRLLEIAKKELPPEYCILNCYTEKEWENSFTRITNGHTIDVSEEKLSEYHGFPFVAGIDIFPLDYVPDDAQAAELQRTLLGLVGDMVSLLDFVKEQETAGASREELADSIQTLNEGLSALEEYFETTIDRKKNIRNQLQKLYDQVCMMYGDTDGDMLASMPSYMKNSSFYFQKDWHADTMQMPFENIMIAVPRGYDEILKRTYHDYMTPINRKAAHDYPFYKDQAEMMMDREGHQTDSADTDEEMFDEDSWGQQQKKKTILYHVNAEQLLSYPARTVAKIKCVLRVFRDNPNVRLWWNPFVMSETGERYAAKYFPEEYEEYREIAQNYKSQMIDEFDKMDDCERAIVLSDAFYGDEGDMLEEYRKTGKPIMVQNYKITEY